MEKSPIHKLEEKLIKRRSNYFRVRRYSFILGFISMFGIFSLFYDTHSDKYEMIILAIKTTIFFFVVSFYGHVRIQHIESILFYRKHVKY